MGRTEESVILNTSHTHTHTEHKALISTNFISPWASVKAVGLPDNAPGAEAGQVPREELQTSRLERGSREGFLLGKR